MPRLILNPGTEGAQTFDLAPGTYEIGRRPDNAICIADGSVSGLHCKLTVNGDTVVLTDLDSTNGTFVEELQITETPLQHGQRLRFGNVDLSFECDGNPTPAPTPAHPPRVRLHVDLKPPAADVEQTVILQKEPPPLAQPTPAGSSGCKYHPKSPARWLCPKCGKSVCDLCVSTRATPQGTTHTCRTCGVECSPLKVQIKRQSTPSFFRVLPGAFVYPFKEGVLALIVGSLIYTLFSVATKIMGGFFAIGLIIFFYGYFFSYLQNVVQATATGETEVEWPTPTDFISDILAPFFQLLVCIVVSFGPAVGLFVWAALAENAALVIGGVAALVYGCFYFPMAFLAVAMFDSVGAVSPTLVIPSIGRVFGKYVIACVLLGLVFAANKGLALLMAILIPVQFVPDAITSFFSLYFLLVEGRTLGLLYWTNKRKLGWFEKRHL